MARPAARRPRPERRRRTADEARAAILDAAERRVIELGPAGLRLQEVAADVGISHSNVLHHFGSREALVQAVIARSFAALHVGLLQTLERSAAEGPDLGAILEGVHRALAEGGHGRVLLWLALEGHETQAPDVRLADVVTAAHAIRAAKCGDETPPREDTAFTVVLAALALVGALTLGPTMLDEAGLGADDATQRRFRVWLAQLLRAHLDGPGGAPAAGAAPAAATGTAPRSGRARPPPRGKPPRSSGR